MKSLVPLPIDEHIPALLSAIRKNQNIVIRASPGAGKTTRLPPRLLELTDKEVWVLEPRRVAALSASKRIAEENLWQLGKEVGYQVRFENRTSTNTRLVFLTEALLMKKLIADPDLKKVGAVILDEFHERSIHTDLAIAALRELQELSRPDLKIIAMSATLNADPLSVFLNQAPIFDIPGKVFPLKIIHEEKSQLITTGANFTQRISQLIRRALRENPTGDLLCFLPGKGEIEWVEKELAATEYMIFPLHGQLSLQEQESALRIYPQKRKIVLATNVAESSLTVNGVTLVVDSGLARNSQIHPKTGFPSLTLSRISLASAIQRAGRAARTAPGTVYRAWNSYDEISMKPFEQPEIFRTDLSDTLLSLSSIGVQNFDTFTWFEKPQKTNLERAETFLKIQEILGSKNELTNLGKRIQNLPVAPRIGKFLLTAIEMGMGEIACEWAALLSEPSSRSDQKFSGEENDLLLRWEKNTLKRSTQLAAEQLKKVLGVNRENSFNVQSMQKLFCLTFGDRLCKRRKSTGTEALMCGGRGVNLHPDSSVRTSEYFIALEMAELKISETTVTQAIGIDKTIVESIFSSKAIDSKELLWIEEKNRFYVREAKIWQGISVGREHLRPAEISEIKGKLAPVLLERWNLLLQKNENLKNLFSRLKALNKMNAQFELPSDEKIREALELASFGENSLATIYQKDLNTFFENLLPQDQLEALNRDCPTFWQVPSGSKIRILYTEEQGPMVEVRLQELFGLKAQPKIAGSPLTLTLLAPNFRPVQVTKDLESFWNSGYKEVRNELRIKYPKHSWPEDPRTAVPQAKGKPRNLL
jgi:ATP-dependent helicase HrpB